MEKKGQLLQFSSGEASDGRSQCKNPWKVLIVDDDEGVHEVTRLSLKRFRFGGRHLQLHHAFSREEGLALLRAHHDFAVALVDVVMETDDAGLRLAREIREEMGNQLIRIILRTGQPGQAPEAQVIEHYDIHDYKEKTELTQQKLTTVLFSALRSYRDLMALEHNREGLEQVINSTSNILKIRSLDRFLNGLLRQVLALFHMPDEINTDEPDAFIARAGHVDSEDLGVVLAGMGRFKEVVMQPVSAQSVPALQRLVLDARHAGKCCRDESGCVFPLNTQQDNPHYIYLEGFSELSPMQLKLAELYCSNASLAHDNVHLYNEIEEDQKTIIYMLGDIAEFRSKETSHHVRRVAEYCGLFARHLGIGERETDILMAASTMHDIGKVAIPDSILQKPDRLTDEEFKIMRRHASYGHEMLRKSAHRPLINAACIIAAEHHEKWDGSGYPEGKAGEDIHSYGRITAAADVFDALMSKRCYKDAWDLDAVKSFFVEQRGRHFDPALVDILFDRLDDFLQIHNRYQDAGDPSVFGEV